tara:strand:- start:49 stop:501 length:453 start_codon:yes stop_codon:yes gene_type:complete
MAKTGYSAVKQVAAKAPTAYWYKINGKKVSKAAYLAYKNKPGGDKPGKSTNDPDASGNKAKTTKIRANNKASKRPTALTEAQSKLTPLKQGSSPAKGIFDKIKGALGGVAKGKGVMGALMNPVGAIGNATGLFMKSPLEMCGCGKKKCNC